MRRILKFSAYGLAGLTALVLLLAVAGLIAVQTSWFRGKVRGRIVYEIEKSTGGRVELGAFDFNWHTLTAQVRNLVIHGTEESGEAPLLRVDSVEVGLKVLSILEKKVDLRVGCGARASDQPDRLRGWPHEPAHPEGGEEAGPRPARDSARSRHQAVQPDRRHGPGRDADRAAEPAWRKFPRPDLLRVRAGALPRRHRLS